MFVAYRSVLVFWSSIQGLDLAWIQRWAETERSRVDPGNSQVRSRFDDRVRLEGLDCRTRSRVGPGVTTLGIQVPLPSKPPES